ncbi:hypothetical protein M885DRAFT_514995 [Pelagophyceae sp. CCMP2097]|nr:hypothetical protein M885DRAFT_514995 [Pelagophyceae sp. CCMP2097]|mmetsp:Transcript_26408/g.94159  ORF Transcript_26408/g.94159 Transcript_26408/m.94159 type:complete len:165 (+) Transcript_26408:80-574(+)
MAKSIRSKIKKFHRSYMRKTVGEKVRTANIDAAHSRGEMKRAGMANTRTLVGMKNALGVDLAQAYYEAVVRPSREADEAEDEDDMEADEEEEDEEGDDEAPAEEVPGGGAKVLQVLLTPAEELEYEKIMHVNSRGRAMKHAGSSVFSRRNSSRSTRPPKELVAF